MSLHNREGGYDFPGGIYDTSEGVNVIRGVYDLWQSRKDEWDDRKNVNLPEGFYICQWCNLIKGKEVVLSVKPITSDEVP